MLHLVLVPCHVQHKTIFFCFILPHVACARNSSLGVDLYLFLMLYLHIKLFIWNKIVVARGFDEIRKMKCVVSFWRFFVPLRFLVEVLIKIFFIHLDFNCFV